MSMTWGELKRWIAEMEPLAAEALLDASTASTAQFQGKPWWDALQARAYDDRPGAANQAQAAGSAFRWNGKAVSADGLKRELAGALGGGFAVA